MTIQLSKKFILIIPILMIITGVGFIGFGVWNMAVGDNDNSDNEQLSEKVDPTTDNQDPKNNRDIDPKPSNEKGEILEGISTDKVSANEEQTEAEGAGEADDTKESNDSPEMIMDESNYIVKSGDTLWDISKEYYDSGFAWNKILEANKSQIDRLENGEQAKIYAGQVLVIPK